MWYSAQKGLIATTMLKQRTVHQKNFPLLNSKKQGMDNNS
jgi:hypothetical protein